MQSEVVSLSDDVWLVASSQFTKLGDLQGNFNERLQHILYMSYQHHSSLLQFIFQIQTICSHTYIQGGPAKTGLFLQVCNSRICWHRITFYILNCSVSTARRYAWAVLAVIVCLCVCLSVRLSVTSRSCTKMAKPRITLTTPYDSPGTLVFRCQKSRRNSNPPTGVPNRGGVALKRRFSTNISLYLRNCAR